MVEIKIGNRNYGLLFNLQVLDDINVKYGSLDGFRRALSSSAEDGSEDVNLSLVHDFAWIITSMANQGIINHNLDVEYDDCVGEKKKILSLDYVLTKLTPADISNSTTLSAVTAAINEGMAADIPEDKNKKVDLVRENIEAKKD